MSGADDAAAEFFRMVVRPTVFDYLRLPSDVRLGCLAAIVLWTTTDHHHAARIQPLPDGIDRRAAREAFVARGEEFAALRDVAEATKHAVRRNNGGIGFSAIPSGVPPGAGGWDIPGFGWNVAGAWVSLDVFIDNGDGTFSSLEKCVWSVARYWALEFGADPTGF